MDIENHAEKSRDVRSGAAHVGAVLKVLPKQGSVALASSFLSLRTEGEAVSLSSCHCERRRREAISSTIRLLRRPTGSS
jgi:hypothetical protein